jgi:hypothetical protein
MEEFYESRNILTSIYIKARIRKSVSKVDEKSIEIR